MSYSATLDTDNNLVSLSQVKEHLGIEDGEVQVVEVMCAAGVASNEYWQISSTVDDYYVWYDVNSGGVDPAVSGKTGIEVDLSTGSSAQEIASATAAAVTAVSGMTAAAVGSVVTVTNDTAGEVLAAVDVDTDFILTTTIEGENIDVENDQLLTDYINEISWLFNGLCDRELKSRAQTEYYDGPGGYLLYLDNPPVTGLTLYQDSDRDFGSTTEISSDDYVLYDEKGKIWLTGTAFLHDARVVKAVYTGGYSTIPHDLQGLCLSLLARKFRKQQVHDEGKKSSSNDSGSSQTWEQLLTDDDYVILGRYRGMGFVGG